MFDKFPYGAGSGLDISKDPFSQLATQPTFGPGPISMAAMAAMAAANMAGSKAASANGQSSPEESLALEMLRKSKGFFPPQHGRPAFPGQPAQLPDVVSTLPAFSHRPDQPKMSPLLAAAGVEPHLRFPMDYPFFNFPNLNRSPASMTGSLMTGIGGQTGSGQAGSDRANSSSGKSASSSSQEDRSEID
jgi:hypothetical protein